MLNIIKKYIQEAYDKGYDAGRQDGFLMGMRSRRALDRRTGVILSPRVKQEIEKIMRDNEQ